MTVKEVVELSAELLGIELTDENTEELLTCYNFVENELAMDYFPLRTLDMVLIKENEIKYADLKNKAWRIINVLDFQNDEVKYRLYPEYIELKKNYNGHYFFVRYNYIPKEKVIDDNCDYDDRYKQVLKYGVCAEYCLMQGNFELASMFDNKYKDGIKEKYAYKKGE